ncbi:TIGR02281 family clan AA aspartic protease [Sphingomonas sp. S2-65]|uniref:retropepsin-like aspartic protease family protein n=1 Tax=Sphingomonas sp. S2-65 TaxID=2903960 RepID=UPI001F3EE9B5|nr:retropepsin-like aspartic protease [Sphingomonas sp. S2-65]UYY57040.1 retroviral-like aspartic protease family protein [Sphingomonas sp. S2-65]
MVDERLLWLMAMVAASSAVLAASRDAGPRGASAAMAVTPLGEAEEAVIEGARVVVKRAPDGLFYVNGMVNGTRIRFLVDTGATALVLAPQDAARAGVVSLSSQPAGELQTAAGATSMGWASARSLEIAGRTLSKVRAAVPGSHLKVSLLGQDVLRRLGSITLDDDRLVIAASTTSARPD